MTKKSTIRIGAGSAHEADDLEAARINAEQGDLDYLVFDCLAEVSIAKAYARLDNGLPGYDDLLEPKLRAVLPGCAKRGTKIILNAGILDCKGAAELTKRICQELGYGHLKVAYVTGGDVTDLLRQRDPLMQDNGKPVSSLGNTMMGALVYGGAREIVDALVAGADIVITERTGDSEQYLAPMIHEFGWKFDDWDKIGRGLGLGHLLECGIQGSGGTFADPAYLKQVPNMDRMGFPLLEVDSNGNATVTKVEGTGGLVSELTMKEQLVYEIDDPANYIHADGVVNFTTTRISQVGPNRVRVEGTTGKPKTPYLKAGIGVREEFLGVSRILYGGDGAVARAKRAAEIVTNQLVDRFGADRSQIRCDLIGYDSLFDWGVDPDSVKEVELRVSGRFSTKEAAAKVQALVSLLPCNGPSAPSWPQSVDQGGVQQLVGFYSALVDRGDVKYELQFV